MTKNAHKILLLTTVIVVGLYFLLTGIAEAAGFLKPLVLAILLTMVLIPLSRKLESWGFHRAISSICAVLVSMLAIVAILGLLVVQVDKVANDWPEIKENLKPQVERLSQLIERTTGLSEEEIRTSIERISPLPSHGADAENGKQADGTDETAASSLPSVSTDAVGTVGSAVMGIFSFMGTFFLVFVYIFFSLFYRKKIKLSILRFFPGDKTEHANEVLDKSVKLSGQYLIGRLILIFFLAVIYSIGLSSFGVKNAILISIFASILTLIPYVGNIIGFVLAMIMATVSGGELWMYLGVVITFSIAQFVESYILQPYVVGDKVDLNPLVTIVVVVMGGAVWGIIGMIISIPLFGIFKIVFDNIPATEPLGYALGSEDVGSDSPGFFEKLANRFRRNSD